MSQATTPGLSEVLAALADRCVSDLAAARAEQLAPAPDAADAALRLDRVDQARALRDGGRAPVVPTRLDLAADAVRASRGAVLDPVQLRQCGAVLRAGAEIAQAAATWSTVAPTLAGELRGLPRHPDLARELLHAFDERDQLRDEASVALARLRREVRELSAAMRQRIEALLRASDDAGLLQDDYWTLRNDRIVLPVRSDSRRRIEGIVHGSSQTGATVFVEPAELVSANNRLALAHEEVRAEERRLLAAMSAQVGAVHGDLVEIADRLAHLDGCLAGARLADDLAAHRPALADAPTLALRRARHPLLVLAGAAVVANDLLLDAGPRWLIVSGPNGGGKTVTLTTVALATEMARRGLPICAAEGSIVPWVDAVECAIGDHQDLRQGRSTFAGHLQRVTQVLDRCAGPGRVLALLDELAGGTEPAAGSALARALLEAFAETPALGLATTHDEAVKLLASHDDRFASAALQLEARTATPTWELRAGAVGASFPLALAARVGLPEAIIERAHALLAGTGSDVSDRLARLDAARQQHEQESERLATARRACDDARERLEAQRRFERSAADRRIAEAAAEGLAAVQAAISAADEARRALAQQPDQIAVEKHSRQLAAQHKAMRALQSSAAAEVEQRAPVDATRLSPGMTVFHLGLGRPVQVIAVDARDGSARVAAGKLELRAEADALRLALPAEAARPTAGPATGDAVHVAGASRGPRPPARGDALPPEAQLADAAATAAMRHPDRTCDLRGMRVEEALAALDSFLDRAAVQAAAGVTVVHGVGTGALRKAVEAHLRGHPHVRHHRRGGPGEGGEGASMVWLQR